MVNSLVFYFCREYLKGKSPWVLTPSIRGLSGVNFPQTNPLRFSDFIIGDVVGSNQRGFDGI